MTDLLSGLQPKDDLTPVYYRRQMIDAMREALTNPTDEQVEAAAQRLAHRIEFERWSELTEVQRDDWRVTIRESWAAAAGGDDE